MVRPSTAPVDLVHALEAVALAVVPPGEDEEPVEMMLWRLRERETLINALLGALEQFTARY